MTGSGVATEARALRLGKDRVLTRVDFFTRPGSRMRGLLGRPKPEEGHAVLLRPCGSVHTFFMRYPIDIVFLDDEDRIVRVVPSLAPWRMAAGGIRARQTLELPSGRIAPERWREGDRVDWESIPGL
ncbi:MAG: DUF192 domain-containing protein [Kiritimatiellia bacterium]|nr:DUF192 domain-containing protein [Kiritimatiellia bacterium]